MRNLTPALLACALAATAPAWSHALRETASHADVPGGELVPPPWPERWRGRALSPLPLSEEERRYFEDFPGRMARFTDGDRQIVVRFVEKHTRKLHPMSDCYRGMGYAVEHLRIEVDAEGVRWSCFDAVKAGDRPGLRSPRVARADRQTVCERYAEAHTPRGGKGPRAWTDVSAWYWSAMLGETRGPWLAWSVAERRTDPR